MTNSTPNLWPGMDRSTPTARAWSAIWHALDADRWLPLKDVIDAIDFTHPDVKRQTIDTLIRKARTARLVQRRGGYSHKTKRDTREIRRHPATQETAAS